MGTSLVTLVYSNESPDINWCSHWDINILLSGVKGHHIPVAALTHTKCFLALQAYY